MSLPSKTRKLGQSLWKKETNASARAMEVSAMDASLISYSNPPTPRTKNNTTSLESSLNSLLPNQSTTGMGNLKKGTQGPEYVGLQALRAHNQVKKTTQWMTSGTKTFISPNSAALTRAYAPKPWQLSYVRPRNS